MKRTPVQRAGMLGLRYAQELDGDIRAAVDHARIRLNFARLDCDQPFSFAPAGTKEFAEAIISLRLGDHVRYVTVLRLVAHVLLDHRTMLVPVRDGLHWRTRCPQREAENAFMDAWLDWCTKPHTDRLRAVMARSGRQLG